MAKLGLEPRCPEVLQGPVQCDPSIPQHTVVTCYMCGQVELSSDLAPSCLLLHSPGRGGSLVREGKARILCLLRPHTHAGGHDHGHRKVCWFRCGRTAPASGAGTRNNGQHHPKDRGQSRVGRYPGARKIQRHQGGEKGQGTLEERTLCGLTGDLVGKWKQCGIVSPMLLCVWEPFEVEGRVQLSASRMRLPVHIGPRHCGK